MAKTKGQIRGSKSKGASFEYDVLHNFQKFAPDMYLCSKQGFVQQYDLRDDNEKIVVECKRHKAISWAQAKRWFNKLYSVAPEGYRIILVYKANHQPVFCMTSISDEYKHIPAVFEWEDVYGKFEKHPSIKKQ
jgi:hypothetical protein